MHKHPTISLWQREEDGSYKAELEGLALHVSWHPEKDGARGFSWKAEGDGKSFASEALAEEIEIAMSDAESAVRAAKAAEAVTPSEAKADEKTDEAKSDDAS